MDLRGLDRIRLVGDEDTGVGLECLDCWDGGRPLAYLLPYPDHIAYRDDPKVINVSTVAELLKLGRKHLDEHHS